MIQNPSADGGIYWGLGRRATACGVATVEAVRRRALLDGRRGLDSRRPKTVAGDVGNVIGDGDHREGGDQIGFGRRLAGRTQDGIAATGSGIRATISASAVTTRSSAATGSEIYGDGAV